MKNGRATTRSRSATFGLLANGSCGPWSIDVDETTSGPDRWFMQIEGPAVSFDFQIPSPGMIQRMSEFLRAGRPSGAELAVGKGKATPVRLVRDDEFDDRFFLVVGPPDAPVVRYTFAGDDANRVAVALEQVQEDLVDG